MRKVYTAYSELSTGWVICFMKQVAFPDFHRKKEPISVAKYLFTQISGEAKLQKIYCARFFLIHMDAFSFLTIDFPCTLKLFTTVSASRHFLAFLYSEKKNSVLSTTCPTILSTAVSHPLDDSRKYYSCINHLGCFPALIFSCFFFEKYVS